MALGDPDPIVRPMTVEELMEKIVKDRSVLIGLLVTCAEGTALVLTPETINGMTAERARRLADILRDGALSCDKIAAGRPQG